MSITEERMKKSTPESEAISENDQKKTSRFGNLGCALFSLPFLLGGAAVIYFLGLNPLLRVVRASGWEATPCVVTSSRIVSHDDTYSVEIHYSYSVNGKSYAGTRYSFFSGSTSGYSGKNDIVQQNPPGKSATCYVNPADPSDAVFYRGYSSDMLWGLFGVPFFLVGVAGLYMAIRSAAGDRKRPYRVSGRAVNAWPTFDAMRAPPRLSTTQGGAALDSAASRPVASVTPPVASRSFGAVVLEPTITPLRKWVITLLVTLFWNGIVSVFLFFLINQWRHGHIEWFLAVFLTPFVLIGLLLLFSVFHGFLALFNPRPRLTLHSGQLRLGEEADLEWEFSGSISRIRQLRIHLEGREEAIYTRGTDTVTDKNVFATVELVNKPGAEPGRVRVEIPSNTMHSFKSDHNKIIWEIHVNGDIGFWSDVDESFELEVLPKRSLVNATL